MARVEGQARTGKASVVYEGIRRGGVHRRLDVQPGRYVAVAFVRAPVALNSRAKLTISLSGRAEDGSQIRNAVLSRSTQQYRAHCVVGLGRLHCVSERAVHRGIQSILFLWAIEANRRHPLVTVTRKQNMFAHKRKTSLRRVVNLVESSQSYT